MSIDSVLPFQMTDYVESKYHFAMMCVNWLTRHRFFAYYRDVACTIYPVIYDPTGFESQMEMMLHNRARAGGVYAQGPPTVNVPEKPFGVSLTWLGLLFAVLASGSQSSELPAKERELTSQVYSKMSQS